MTSIRPLTAPMMGSSTAPARPAAAPAPGSAPIATDDPANHPGLLPDVIADRLATARIAENTPGVLPPDVIKRGAPAYFRTYEQLKGAMQALEAKYPGLVTVTDIGDSHQKTQGTADRDILAITITNKASTGPKAKVEHVAGLHAREIANPELLMTWATQLVEGYGRDPEATALLNTREIHLVPMVNPDGHAYIERAYAGAAGGDMMKRKNASGTNGAGTDLNRNFEFHWGGAGASTNPSSDTYRGPSAASEPEVQAVQNYTKTLKPNMFTDWHSYSKLNMYPWGDTKDKAPDYVGLKAVADKMSTFNHYSPVQSVALYPTTGTTDDTAYGAYGIPSWAVETGSSFHQSDQEFAKTLAENLPVLQWGAKIADKPLERVHGPDVTDVLVDPATRAVTASLSEATSGKDGIAGAELVLNPDAPVGSGVALAPADGAWGGVNEVVTGEVKLPGGLVPNDGQLAYVRAQDAKGNWGPLTAQWIVGPAGPAEAAAAR